MLTLSSSRLTFYLDLGLVADNYLPYYLKIPNTSSFAFSSATPNLSAGNS